MAPATPSGYFGQQVRRARRAAGWTLAEFGQRIGYDPRADIPDREWQAAAHGTVRADVRPGVPRSRRVVRRVLRRVPPARSRTPPWFRGSVEHESGAATLRIWQLSVLSGLLQTEEYARGILTVNPGVTDDQVSERLAGTAGPPGDPGPG